MTLDQSSADLQRWLAEEGLGLGAFHDPSLLPRPAVEIVLDARGASEKALCLSVASLLAGTVQRCPIRILRSDQRATGPATGWIRDLSDVKFAAGPDDLEIGTAQVLVVPAGVIFGRYSVEAAIEARHLAGCELLRSVVDGAPGSLELWQGGSLTGVSRSAAEAGVRERNGERWVAGSSLGLRFMGKPAPKQFLKKGVAGQLEQIVVVRDLRDPLTRHDYEQKIRDLQAELQRARKSMRAAGTEVHSSPRGKRIWCALRKGPRYTFQAVLRRMGRFTKGA